MSFPLIPDKIVKSIYELDLDSLSRQGVRLILADLDNTIARYHEWEPSQKLKDWAKEVEAHGMTLFVLSNGRKPWRSKRFCEGFLPFISHASKPHAKNFYKAMELNGCAPEETIMLGDQIFTDIWGAHNAGLLGAVYVRGIALDTIFRKLRYAIEAPFRGLCRLRGERL
jgi:hypothetical protein